MPSPLDLESQNGGSAFVEGHEETDVFRHYLVARDSGGRAARCGCAGLLRDRERIGPGQRLPVLRAVIVLAALVALWRIMVPLASTVEVRSSQSAAAVGAWPAALRDANAAQSVEPGAASPRVQRALVLEAVATWVPLGVPSPRR